MTTNEAIKPGESGSSARPSEGQWALIWREFRRRRLAVAGAVLILFLFTISVYAPFLANGIPISYYGHNLSEYKQSVRTLRGALRNLARMQQGDETKENEQETLVNLVRTRIGLMSAAVTAEGSAELAEFAAEFEKALSSGDTATLRRLSNDVRKKLGINTVRLKDGWHYPVFASLNWLDIIFMVFNFFLVAVPLWWPLIRRVIGGEHPAIRRNCVLAVLVGLPLLCGAVWKGIVPERIDRTDYKAAVKAGEESSAEKNASVVYQRIIWPLIPYSLDEDDLGNKYATSSKEHWMGTDGIGRDVMCRMVWGGRVSLAVGVVAVSIYVVIGIVVGSIAGYFRGTTDLLISRVIEVVICFPSFFLILTIVAFLGPSIFNIMIVIGVIGWTSVARLVRGEFLKLGAREFVQAGRALGYSPVRIIFRHVLPNAIAPVLVAATFGIAGAILTESALSFLGFGITVPKPSWGGILASGRESVLRAPWLIYYPGIAIFLTITSYNLVGEALRDAADPRLRGSR